MSATPPIYKFDPESSRIFEACKSRGSKLYHYKGSYTLVIYDWFTDCDGMIWISAFRQESCDMTYAFAEGAFLAINRDRRTDVPRDNVVLENFYKSNQMLMYSLDRILEKNSQGNYKFSPDKPPEGTLFQPIVIDHLTPKLAVQEKIVEECSLFNLMQ